jgi:AcrR family transcriptional regulator
MGQVAASTGTGAGRPPRPPRSPRGTRSTPAAPATPAASSTPSAPAPSGPGRPQRADARRNRLRLLDAARGAFAEKGTEASLDDIAKQAGVGIGTLYRHFPTREALVAGVIDGRTRDLCALADRLAAREEPFEALHQWLRAMVDHVAAFEGLARSIVAAGADPDDGPLAEACHAMEAAGARVFGRAQASGDVRPDATAADAMDLAASVAWVAGHAPRHEGQADHLLALALDGLRPR